jgi:hypothetical protein
MSDVTNWQCPTCGEIVSGAHSCPGFVAGKSASVEDPRDGRLAELEAENKRLREIADAAKELVEANRRRDSVAAGERLGEALWKHFGFAMRTKQ